MGYRWVFVDNPVKVTSKSTKSEFLFIILKKQKFMKVIFDSSWLHLVYIALCSDALADGERSESRGSFFYSAPNLRES